MLELHINTIDFFWADYKEYLFATDQVKISNKNVGLQTSTFRIQKGDYTLLISTKKLDQGNVFATFYGTPKLSGSEQDNQFLEEFQMTEPHRRIYHIPSEEINLFIYKDYLIENNLLDKEIYVYLIKRNQNG